MMGRTKGVTHPPTLQRGQFSTLAGRGTTNKFMIHDMSSQALFEPHDCEIHCSIAHGFNNAQYISPQNARPTIISLCTCITQGRTRSIPHPLTDSRIDDPANLYRSP